MGGHPATKPTFDYAPGYYYIPGTLAGVTNPVISLPSNTSPGLIELEFPCDSNTSYFNLTYNDGVIGNAGMAATSALFSEISAAIYAHYNVESLDNIIDFGTQDVNPDDINVRGTIQL